MCLGLPSYTQRNSSQPLPLCCTVHQGSVMYIVFQVSQVVCLGLPSYTQRNSSQPPPLVLHCAPRLCDVYSVSGQPSCVFGLAFIYTKKHLLMLTDLCFRQLLFCLTTMVLAKKDETWCVSLCHTLCEMRQSSSFSDVIIQADGDNVLKAHTCVLAAASPVLKTQLLLSQHYLYVPKISKCMWEVLLQFIYTGNLEIPQPSEITGILKAGKRLQLTRLTSLCEDLLKDKGGKDKCAQVKEPRNIIVETETSQAEFGDGMYTGW